MDQKIPIFSEVLKIRTLLSALLWCPNLWFGIWCDAVYNLACYVCQPVVTLRHFISAGDNDDGKDNMW